MPPSSSPTQIILNTTKDKMISNKRLLALTIIVAIFAGVVYKPLPDDFPQPWKYRLICFGSNLLLTVVSEVFLNRDKIKTTDKKSKNCD